MEDRKQVGSDAVLRLATLAFGCLLGCIATVCIFVGTSHFVPSVRSLAELPGVFWILSFDRGDTASTPIAGKEVMLQSALKEITSLSFGEPPLEPVRASAQTNLGGGRERLSPLFFGRSTKLETIRPDRIPLENFFHSLETLPLGSPVLGEVNSGFGRRLSPFSGTRQMHSGVDLDVESSTGVTATAEGTVTEVGYRSSYGKTILIDHGNGFETLFAHLSDIQVNVGDRVCRGQQIGLSGATGMTTGPHLHYEIRFHGEAQNPEPMIDMASYLEHLFDVDLSS